MISLSAVHWFMGESGWTFKDAELPDSVNQAQYMHQVYTAAKRDYTGRVTVPVLWDKHRGTIVSNESSEIIRMFNSAFDGLGAAPGDYYPEALREEIDTINERVYHTVNNGVYRSGFATTQEAYEEAVGPAVRIARLAGGTPFRTALPHGQRDHRSGLAPGDDAVPFRSRLRRTLQVQPEANRGLPHPIRLHAGSCISIWASPKPCAWITSRRITTAVMNRSIPRASCRGAPK